VGINYIDACAGPEVMAYSKVLKGRRDKMYLGYSWFTKESRFTDWRSSQKLMDGFNEGLREAQLDYVDLWRITLPMERFTNLDDVLAVEEGATKALELAKKQGQGSLHGAYPLTIASGSNR